jgi:hypothetical protein
MRMIHKRFCKGFIRTPFLMRHSPKWSLRYVCVKNSIISHADSSCKRFHTASSSLDVETLGHISRILSTNDAALDLVSLHVELSTLVSSALAFVEEYDIEAVGRFKSPYYSLKYACRHAPQVTPKVLSPTLVLLSCLRS